ncbi:MAG: redox-sensing transcriptional repressor Rex [Candidatus Omnitrophica bacterium]|nr:redox-sensing transcriptional repressor Rex [Candidatus Omnitrophota bacterium]MDD5487739.1 redox-sensing transcriptional repressor Rex [Candidatus Omnitrophota bacterium]
MKKVPKNTINRSFLYIRTLEKLIAAGRDQVSSGQIAELTGLTDVQIRKDISNFGKVGKPRVGYSTKELKKILEEFISYNVAHVVLFGVGNLGSAILKYPGFHQDKIKLVAAFDRDSRKVGREINGVKIYSVDKAMEVIPRNHADIGIIAVPEEHSQAIADIMVSSGLKGIVNFSPTTVSVPGKVKIRNIDLAIEFLSLFCQL